MDKIIIQESLAPLLALLNSNNSCCNNGNNNNSNDMQSTLTNNLDTTGQFIHNPGTGDTADDVIIKPQDISVSEKPTGRNFMDKPTYTLNIENPTTLANRREFVQIGSIAQNIDSVIDAKAIVSIYNSYGFQFIRQSNDILLIRAYSNGGSYVRDALQFFQVTPEISFDLFRIQDSSTIQVSIPIANTSLGQVSIDVNDLANDEEFEIQNFTMTDSSGFSDEITAPIPIQVSQSLFGQIGEIPHKEALMNIDLHYKSSAYPDEHIQLLYASDFQYFFSNKLNGGSDGRHLVKNLILEYTKI